MKIPDMRKLLQQILFVFAIISLVGCKDVVPPELKEIRNIKIGSIIDNEMIVNGDALIANPNGFSALLNMLEVEVYIGERKVATIEEAVSYKILPKEDSAVPLRGKINLKTVEAIINEQGMKILLGQELPITFKGSAKAKVHGVNLKVPINFTEKINLRNLKM